MERKTEMAGAFPEEALEHVLCMISSHADRNSVSLVCKSWYDIERWCRRHVFIGNCYAVRPVTMTQRFTAVGSIAIKGKHFTGDYDFVPEGWGAHALPWIEALSAAYPATLQEIRLKRMVVTDEGLELIAKSHKNLRNLVLRRCEGFSTHGLASIAAHCRHLRTLDLFETEVEDAGVDWISFFPDSFTSLQFLNVDSFKYDLPFSSLELLVGRCPNLTALRLNLSFPLSNLVTLLLKAPPQLVDLGTGSFTMDPCPQAYAQLATALAANCKPLKSLSGLSHVHPYYLPALHPVCLGLTSLSLRYSALRCPDFIKLLPHCPNLQHLCVLDFIEDRGLEQVAIHCKELQELWVIFSDPYGANPNVKLTERGLVSVAIGCPKLRSVLYYCSQMTNAALVTIANHRPALTNFHLCILEPQLPDYLTHQPLDNGYAAIIENCRDLKRLVITGLVTDRLLQHLGIHGKKLELLGLAFSGDTDMGLHHVLSGCNKLRRFGIMHSPFGGRALLANSHRLERLQYFWMSSCMVSYGECKLLAEKHPRLNVEVITEQGPLHSSMSSSLECPVENLYVYRTIAGPRLDMPEFVRNANQTGSLPTGT